MRLGRRIPRIAAWRGAAGIGLRRFRLTLFMPPDSPQGKRDGIDFDFDLGDAGESAPVGKTAGGAAAGDGGELIVRRGGKKKGVREAPSPMPAEPEAPAVEPGVDPGTASGDVVIRRGNARRSAPAQAEEAPEPAAGRPAESGGASLEIEIEGGEAPEVGGAAAPSPAGELETFEAADAAKGEPPAARPQARDFRPVPNPFAAGAEEEEEELHELDLEPVELELPVLDRPPDRPPCETGRTFSPEDFRQAVPGRDGGGGRKIALLAIGLLAVGAAIFFFTRGGGGDGDTAPAEGPGGGDPEPAPPAVAGDRPIPPAAGERMADTERRIAHTLSKFFGAESADALLPFVRHPERVAPAVRDHYQGDPPLTPELESVGHVEEVMVRLKTFWLADVILDGKVARKVILEDTDRGFVVDWEEFVCYNPIGWGDYVDNRPSGRNQFRVLATIDHRPGYAFPDPAKWLCVHLRSRDDERALYGYAPAGTPLAAKLEEALTDQGVKEWEYPCILELEFPPDPKGGEDQVHIRDLVIEHWVIVD